MWKRSQLVSGCKQWKRQKKVQIQITHGVHVGKVVLEAVTQWKQIKCMQAVKEAEIMSQAAVGSNHFRHPFSHFPDFIGRS